MKYFIFFALCLVLSTVAIAQQRTQGIKMLVNDRTTGVRLRDSLMITFNDSIRRNAVSDTGGFYFFQLPVGKYSVRVDRKYYYSQILNGMTVGENKTSYLTMEIEKIQVEKKKKAKKKKRKKKSLVTG